MVETARRMSFDVGAGPVGDSTSRAAGAGVGALAVVRGADSGVSGGAAGAFAQPVERRRREVAEARRRVVFMWGCHWTVLRHTSATDLTTYHSALGLGGTNHEVPSFWWALGRASPTSGTICSPPVKATRAKAGSSVRGAPSAAGFQKRKVLGASFSARCWGAHRARRPRS